MVIGDDVAILCHDDPGAEAPFHPFLRHPKEAGEVIAEELPKEWISEQG